MSANYNTQKGIVVGDSYKRLGGKANIVANVTDWLKIGMNSSVNVSSTSQVDAARNGSNFAVGGFPRMALANSPNMPIYDENGKGYYDHSLGVLGYGPNAVMNTFSNPVALVELGNKTNVDVNRILSSFFAEVTPVKGLTLKTQYNIDDARIENSRFWSPNHGDGVNKGGYAFNAAVHSSIWTWTNTATYDLRLIVIISISWWVWKLLKTATMNGMLLVQNCRMISLRTSKELLPMPQLRVIYPRALWFRILDVSTMTLHRNTCSLSISVVMVFLH